MANQYVELFPPGDGTKKAEETPVSPMPTSAVEESARAPEELPDVPVPLKKRILEYLRGSRPRRPQRSQKR